MSDFRAAGRYAKSIIDLSQEQQALDHLYNDMKLFIETYKKNPALQDLLTSPIITSDKKMAVLNKLFAVHMHKLSISFFEIITRKNRAIYLKAIAEAVISQYNEIKNIAKASVKSAVALDAKTNEEIRSFIAKSTGKNIELESTVDERLIGGLVVMIGDKLYDGSISGSLNKAKKELLNTYISK